MYLAFKRGIFVLLALVIACSVFADLPSLDIKRLLSEHKDLPKEIINPPSPPLMGDSLKERFRLFWMERVLGFRVTRIARGKACLANQRVIAGAIEMYDMDHSSSFKNFTDGDATDPSGRLVVGKYLKMPISLPGKDCKYCYYGSPDNGFIYCKVHGTLSEYQRAIAKEKNIETPVDRADRMIKMTFLGGLIFIIAVLVSLKFIRKKPHNATK